MLLSGMRNRTPHRAARLCGRKWPNESRLCFGDLYRAGVRL